MSYWRLECWWPLSKGMGTSAVTKIVGRDPSDSGAGFGKRDVGWHYKDSDYAEGAAAFARLKKAGYECAFNEYTDNHKRRQP